MSAEFIAQNKRNLLVTFLVCISYLLYGIVSVSPGTALLDLQVLIQQSFSTTSRLITIKQVGYFCGGLLVGPLESHVDLYLLMAGVVTTFGLAEILVPLTTNFIFMGVCCFMMGASQGIVEMVSHILCINLWKEKSTNSIQILHMCYAIGALVCPLIIRPFMLPSTHEVAQVEDEVEIVGVHGLLHTPDEVRVHWAFLIVGVPSIITGLCYIFFYERSDEKKAAQHESDEKSKADDGSAPSMIRQYLICIFVAIACTTSFPVWLIVGCFSQAYGVKSDLKLTRQAAALIATIFWCFFIVSRLCYVGLSMIVNRKILLIMFVSILSAGAVVMLTFSSGSFVWLMVGMILIGFGASPISGLAISWPSQYFMYSGKQTSTIFLVGLAGESLHPIILGHFFDDNPKIFVYYLGALAGIFAILFSLIPPLCKFVLKKPISHTLPDPNRGPRDSIHSAIMSVERGRRSTVISLRMYS